MPFLDPKISIVTPVYNSGTVIADLINSIIDQSYQNWEMIIQDGKSIDGTIDIVRQYASDERIKIYSEEDNGMYDALNKAISKTSGDYILHLNSDEQLIDDALNLVVEKIKSNSAYDVYCFGTIIIDMNYTPRVFRPAYPQSSLLIKLFNFDVFTAGIIYNKKVFNELSFDTQYKAVSDAILFVNILQKFHVYYSEAYTSLFLIRGDNLSLDMRAKTERESLIDSVNIPKILHPILKLYKKLRKAYFKTFDYKGPKKITLFCNGSKKQVGTEGIKHRLDWSTFKV